MRAARRALVAIATGTLLGCATVGSAAPAQAASYRYWSYWLGGQQGWTFATAGPAFRIPADGSVEGWRFAVAGQGGGAMPRADAATTFDAACAATASRDGAKRVAVVIDAGTPEDSPDGSPPPALQVTCVVADEDATGYEVLRAITTARVDDGLVCAIGGFPATGCGEVVGDAPGGTSPTGPPADEAADDDTAAVGGDDAGSGATTEPTGSNPTSTRDPGSAGTAPGEQDPAEGAPNDPAAPGDTSDDTTSAARPDAAEPAASGTGSRGATPDEGGDPTATPQLAFGQQTPTREPQDPQTTPVAAVTPVPAEPGSGPPVAVLLVVAGAAMLGGAAWIRTSRGRP